MTEKHLELAKRVAQQYGQLPQVETVVIGGSLATGNATLESDIDLYVYLTADIAADERLAIAREFAGDAKTNDFWGSGNEWIDPETKIHVDMMFWTTGWIEDQVERVLARHEAWVGYSTCFWHTVRHSRILFDRNGWFHQLHARAQANYPEPMIPAIIAQNYPILRDNPSAYIHQLEKALSRGDLVSVNHRLAGLLASYFDILFAVNRLPHPGEKHLLAIAETTCKTLPENMIADVTTLLHAAGQGDAAMIQQIHTLVDRLDAWLVVEGFAP